MIEQIIENKLSKSKDYIFGFANLKGLLSNEFEKYPYGISIGKRLDNKIVDAIENGPTVKYFNHYKEINSELNDLSTNICKELKEENINCINIVPTVPTTSGLSRLITN